MTSDGTTEAPAWCPPGGTPAGAGPAFAPPPDPYASGPSAQAPPPGYIAVRTPVYRQPPPGNGMAIGTLWTGVGSLVLGFFSIGALGILGGAAGFVLGMVTLRRVRRGTATGSDTATFGMALSLMSIVIGSMLLLSAWPMLVDAFEQGWEQGTQP